MVRDPVQHVPEVARATVPAAVPRRRRLAARIRPAPPEPVDNRAEVRPVPSRHPLEPVLPLLGDTLHSIVDEALHTLIVTDAHGRVLWCGGPSAARGRTEIVVGTGSTASSTDPPGTALRTDRAERRDRHGWSRAAQPVHDPDSGAVIGAVDVTGPTRRIHPSTLALVVAAARLAEGHLAAQLALRNERLLTRTLARLPALRDEPHALLTASGRVLAAQPPGWLPARVVLPTAGDRVALGELGEGVLEPLADGWLLRVPGGARPHPSDRPRGAGRG